jgi:hypothetical protein
MAGRTAVAAVSEGIIDREAAPHDCAALPIMAG